MFKLSRLSIKSKLQIMLLVASLGSILVVGYLSWSKARDTLTERIFSQLTSIRASKAYQIESYFETLTNHIETLCEDRMVVEAMSEFNQGFKQLDRKYIPPDWDRGIAAYYNSEFLPRLEKNITGTPVFATYRPRSPASRYLQYHYIANNSNPVGKKDELQKARDGSKYSRIHARYHRIFRNLIKKFDYYDLFLIDSKTGNIVYSVYKETDFGTSLNEKPLLTSNLAEVVKKVRANPDRGAIQIVDFGFYRPSYNAPAAFVAGSIYDGDEEVGILAVQLPVNEVNNVLTGNRNWKRDGLGNTGETYLVGSDLLMRSLARPLLEDKKAYLSTIRGDDIKSKTSKQIEQLDTSILLQKVNTTPAREAISGKSGTQQAENYLGNPTLSSYSPVNIRGVYWGIIADIDLTEAYQPINELQYYLLVSTIILVLLVLFYAVIAAQRFIKSINTLVESCSKIEAGELDTKVVFNTEDEFNEIARVFNGLVNKLRTSNELLEQKTQENEALLLNILPQSVVSRFKKGNRRLGDCHSQVTIVYIRIEGLIKIASQGTVEETANLFNELINILDEAGEKHQCERLSIFGDCYIACSGLTKARLDNVNCGVEFGLEALEEIKRFNRKHNTSFSLHIGVNTGAVMAAVVGKQKLQYQVWGETIEIANRLQKNAQPNTIRVTQAVYERVSELHAFIKGSTIIQDEPKLPTWELGKSGLQDLINDLTTDLNFDDDNSVNSKSNQIENS